MWAESFLFIVKAKNKLWTHDESIWINLRPVWVILDFHHHHPTMMTLGFQSWCFISSVEAWPPVMMINRSLTEHNQEKHLHLTDGLMLPGSLRSSQHFPSSTGANSIHLHAVVFNYGNYHRAALQSRFELKPFWEQKQGNDGREKLPERKKESSGGSGAQRGSPLPESSLCHWKTLEVFQLQCV